MFPGVTPLTEDAGPAGNAVSDLHHVTGALSELSGLRWI